MGRTVDIAGAKKGMKIRTVVEGEVTYISETKNFIQVEVAGAFSAARQAERLGYLPGSLSFEVISEAPVTEPSPGSVVRTPDNDMFCRIESDRGSWQRVDGTGITWNWPEILSCAGTPEILFDPEADTEQHGEETPRPSTTAPCSHKNEGVPTHIETPADWDNGDTELRKYPWVDADFDTWTWNWANEIWMVVNRGGYARYRAKNLADMAAFPITRVAQAPTE